MILNNGRKIFFYIRRYGASYTISNVARYIFFIFYKKIITKEKRSIHRTNFKKILFICTYFPIRSRMYRVQNVCESLKRFYTRISYIEDFNNCKKDIRDFNCIILFRIEDLEKASILIKEARLYNIPVFYSTDDLLFHAEYIDLYLELPKMFSKYDKEFYINKAKNIERIARLCDGFLGSTEYLSDIVKNFIKTIKVYTLKNGLNEKQIMQSHLALLRRKERKKVIIGYFPGTRTHDKDFKQIQNVLLKILSIYENIELRVVGFLYIDNAFLISKKKFYHKSFIDPQKIFYEIAGVDINIAPLEVENPIVESKSELKYFEAGIVMVPTIASPTSAFRYAIRHGENGFLASNEDEWYDYLKLLIEDGELRKKIGENAYQDVLERYSPEALTRDTEKVFREMLD